MKINGRKLLAVTEMKARALFDKNVIIVPIMILGITILMRFVYGAMMDGKELPAQLLATVLNLGLTMNITMTGTFVTSAALAEEKEKHTLRMLMTSSVNGIEFFLGSIIPPFIEIMILNIALIPISGIFLASIPLGMYLLATALASITSCILGMLLGIYAKNQMSASTLTTPVILVFMLIPSFSAFIPSWERSQSSYTQESSLRWCTPMQPEPHLP